MVKIESYFEAFLLLFLIGLFLFIIHSFILPLLLAAMIVFMVYKPYRKLDDKLKRPMLSTFIMLFAVFFIILIPIFLVGLSLVSETTNLINYGKLVFDDDFIGDCDTIACETISPFLLGIDFNLEKVFNFVVNYISNSIGDIFNSVSKFFLDIFVFILAFFFLLKDGDKFSKYLKRIVPMRSEYKNALFIKFRDVSMAVFVNTIFVAMIQGTFVGIGFWLIGIQSPIFWGVVASFCALFPLFGPTLVWGPAAFFLAISGDSFGAIFLALYGLFVVSVVDNIARPLLLRNKIEVHQFLILLSILGGIEVFGFFMGLFIGPMVISFLVAVLHLYNLKFE